MSMRGFLGRQIFYQKLLPLAIYIFMDVPYPLRYEGGFAGGKVRGFAGSL